MATNAVIVALPEQNERVNELSSEKLAHLTLLFLGDVNQIADLQGIVQFVEHAVEVAEHGPFMLDVDHRGELGVDQADVLFFRKDWSFKWINSFRSQLLQNSSIRAAYESTEQFAEWNPHLTMGYPATPAKKPEPDDAYRLGWVSFDRIAVWTGDFEGPEFRLEWPERYDEVDSVGWSAVDEARRIATNEALAHHGIKGMRWGVRSRDRKYVQSQKLKDKAYAQDAKSVGVNPLHRNFLQKRATSNRIRSNRLDREVTVAVATKARKSSAKEMRGLRKRPEFQNINYRDENGHPKFDTEKYKKLEKEETKIYLSHLNKAVAPQKQFEVTIKDDSWEFSPKREAQHAGDPTPGTFRLKPIRDEDHFLIDLELIDPPEAGADMAHTVERGAEFLEHYGVKGMRWGIRRQTERSTPEPVAPKATSVVPASSHKKTKIQTDGGENHPAHQDAIKVAEAKAKLKKSGTEALSNAELREVANRLQLEAQVKQLTSSTGQKFVGNLLRTQGQNEINSRINANRQQRLRPQAA